MSAALAGRRSSASPWLYGASANGSSRVAERPLGVAAGVTDLHPAHPYLPAGSATPAAVTGRAHPHVGGGARASGGPRMVARTSRSRRAGTVGR